MGTPRAKQMDIGPTIVWALRLGGWSIAAFTGIYLWPVLQKVGEDEGLFGARTDRFAPILGWALDILGTPVFWTSIVATSAATVGFFYGRWLQGVLRADNPDGRIRITSPDEATATLDLQVLGHTFRLNRSLDPIEELQNPISSHSESLNRIATSVMRWLKPFGGRVVVIASDRPSAGKTSTSFGLGTTLAAFGKRVLIIDADLRNPSLHRLAQVENNLGFTDVAVGAAAPKAVIQKTDQIGLEVMASGIIPTAPVAMVARSNAPKWISSLSRYYDFILIDTAPLGFAEVLQLVDIADALIYVVEHGSNLRQSRTVLDQIRRMSDTQAAAIMTNIPPRSGAVAWSGYSYSYNYKYNSSTLDS